jgi:hypothetical protein
MIDNLLLHFAAQTIEELRKAFPARSPIVRTDTKAQDKEPERPERHWVLKRRNQSRPVHQRRRKFACLIEKRCARICKIINS